MFVGGLVCEGLAVIVPPRPRVLPRTGKDQRKPAGARHLIEFGSICDFYSRDRRIRSMFYRLVEGHGTPVRTAIIWPESIDDQNRGFQKVTPEIGDGNLYRPDLGIIRSSFVF